MALGFFGRLRWLHCLGVQSDLERWIMILPRFGLWSSSFEGKLAWRRIYWKGYKWTPFCRVSWRYKTKGGPVPPPHDLEKEPK